MDKKHKAVLAVLITFITLLVAAFISWAVFFRYWKSTTDSYVHGNPILITPQISSYITSIHTDDTFYVEEGQIIIKMETIDFETVFTSTVMALG